MIDPRGGLSCNVSASRSAFQDSLVLTHPTDFLIKIHPREILVLSLHRNVFILIHPRQSAFVVLHSMEPFIYSSFSDIKEPLSGIYITYKIIE